MPPLAAADMPRRSDATLGCCASFRYAYAMMLLRLPRCSLRHATPCQPRVLMRADDAALEAAVYAR